MQSDASTSSLTLGEALNILTGLDWLIIAGAVTALLVFGWLLLRRVPQTRFDPKPSSPTPRVIAPAPSAAAVRPADPDYKLYDY